MTDVKELLDKHRPVGKKKDMKMWLHFGSGDRREIYKDLLKVAKSHDMKPAQVAIAMLEYAMPAFKELGGGNDDG